MTELGLRETKPTLLNLTWENSQQKQAQGSASDWLKQIFSQPEALPRSG